MSRIREALEKAAKERSVRGSGQTSGDIIDILEAETPGGASVRTEVQPSANESPRNVAAVPPEFAALVSACRAVEFVPTCCVFAKHASDYAAAERFRTLRSRLFQISCTRPLRCLLLTSSVPGEGKTFVASNLAQSFTRQAGRKTLLIDADLRVSRLHHTLGAQNEPGLSDYLKGDADLTEVLQVGKDGGLCFIPGGTLVSDPSGLLHGEKMKALLERMARIFDWVILDSPPAIAVHDASILADMCDGVLFVVRAGATDFAIAQKAAAEFQEEKLLGVVLNRADRSESYGEYYYGYSSAKPD
jgi:capsular exopolysaccharide synthesis family protein